MSETGDETPAAAPLSSREFMEMDLDLDAASWPPFDQIAAFVSSPLPPFLISSPQSLLHFSFPPQPPSPVWLFEDRPAEIPSSPANSSKAVHGCSDTSHNTNGDMKREEGRAKLLQLATAEENPYGSHAIKERMSQALRYVKESIDRHILAQVWAPVKNGDRYVLTTSGQPFVLDPQSTRLLQYRMVSVSYMFSVDEDNDVDLGLPGRVFKQKLPEWTPNVQYYSRREYLRLNHALQYDVQGTLALPVFEPSGQTCVGVVELIMTSQKIHYASEVDKVCKALEAVNLKSSEISGRHPNVQICNEGRQAALAEILEILTVVCEAHKLPLAQTWVPCMHRSVMAHGGGLIKSCSSFDGSCMGKVCMSTTDAAFYVVEPHMWGFRDACVEHHLQKGQGVAGRAFESHRPWFCRDVTQFNKVQYPLVHYARMFGLASCLAICLQSTRSGEDDYILEFFLPFQCKDASEQQALLDSISTVMRKYSRSLKVITELDLEEGLPLEVIEMLANEYHEPKPTSPEDNPEGLDGSQNEGDAVPISQKEHLVTDAVVVNNGNGTPNPALCNKNNGIQLRKRGKAEKSISLEVLQRYFAGSLKDAAKSLGVCPTTMKRICRQHGISRWPSRKINKVNRSLSKLKRVMESVHGAEGAFDLTNLPLAAGSSFPDFDKDPSPRITDDRESKVIVGNELELDLDLDRNPPQPEAEKESDCSKTRSSSEGSVDGSGEQQKGKDPLSSPIEESGSSKDLRDLCNNPTGENEAALGSMQEPLQAAATREPRMVTIKASYKEDIIRFRIPCTAALVALNDEVAKRLKLEVGTFDVKYLDDDHEWVVLACDGDLEECMEISSLSGAHLIRLTVDDVATNLGSSCGST